MRRWSLAAVGMWAALACGRPAPGQEKDAARPEHREPPLEFTLEIDGKPVDIETDRPVRVKVGEKEVTAKLVAKPTRLLRTPELSFRYPSGHGFEVDAEDPSVTLWTLDGNDNVLILTRVAQKLAPADLVAQTVGAIAQEARGLEVKRSKVEAGFGGRKHPGARAEWKVGTQTVRQDVYAFEAGNATYSLVVQDTPGEDGATTAETRRMMELLEKTFKILEKA